MPYSHERPDTNRLWTPWRFDYVGGQEKSEGCVFCQVSHNDDDVQDLVLFRGEQVFIIMNLYPYNTGHVMIIPYQHAISLEELPPSVLGEMATLLPTVVSALRRGLGCEGFNVGMNLGSVAGAGIAAHLHQHVVPRWIGDANFMPIIASTKTLPELIPVTHAKLRCELTRQLTGHHDVEAVVLNPAQSHVLLKDNALPRVEPDADSPAVPAMLRHVANVASRCRLTGWAGHSRADQHEVNRITLQALWKDADLDDGWSSVAVDALPPDLRTIVDVAIAQRAPDADADYTQPMTDQNSSPGGHP